MSTVAISICWVVYLQLDNCWMGQAPCNEGFIGHNAVSTRIIIAVKKGWGIIIDTFAHFWGKKIYSGYSITLVWK